MRGRPRMPPRTRQARVLFPSELTPVTTIVRSLPRNAAIHSMAEINPNAHVGSNPPVDDVPTRLRGTPDESYHSCLGHGHGHNLQTGLLRELAVPTSRRPFPSRSVPFGTAREAQRSVAGSESGGFNPWIAGSPRSGSGQNPRGDVGPDPKLPVSRRLDLGVAALQERLDRAVCRVGVARDNHNHRALVANPLKEQLGAKQVSVHIDGWLGEDGLESSEQVGPGI